MVTPIADAARQVLRDHHSLSPRVVAYQTGSGQRTELPVTRCVVTKDAGALPRCTAAIEVGDASYAPSNLDSLLLPFSTYVDVSAVIGQGPRSWEVTVHDGLAVSEVVTTRPNPVFALTAADQARRLAERQHTTPRTPPKAATTLSVIRDYITRSYPSAAFDIQGIDADDKVGELTLDGRHVDAVRTLAAAIGAEVFPRYDGVWVIRPYPALSTAPTVDMLYTGDGGVVTATSSRVTRSFNDVVLRFGNPDPKGADVIGRATAQEAPFLPSTYGRVTYVENRAGRRTQAEADAAAARKLRRIMGRTRTVTITCPTHPHLEPGDTAQVLFANGRVERLVLERCVHDLSPGGSSVLTTRQTTWGAT